MALAASAAWWPASLGFGEPLATISPIKPPPAAVATAPDGIVQPLEWMPSRGRECRRYKRGRWYCQGPRRVPKPFGEAAGTALLLGLGDIKTVSHLLLNPPKPEWVKAAGPAHTGALRFPIEDGVVWRGLQRGRRIGGKFHPRHKGLDIGGSIGTPIHAVEDAIVAYADNGVRGYGNLLIAIHGDGSVVFYAHCKEIYVFPGQRIARGQVVAIVGETGLARGPHLHFEYRKDGRVRDPRPRFEQGDAPTLANIAR